MHSLLGPQYDAEIAYRQERTRHEFAVARRSPSGWGRLISRHRRPAAPSPIAEGPSR